MMKSREEFLTKATELENKIDNTAVDVEAAAILRELAGYDEEDFVTEFGAMGMLDDYKSADDKIVNQAIEMVEHFLF